MLRIKQLLLILRRSAESGAYSVYPDGENGTKVEVYCHMTEIPGCGEGGWTLVMKIDGTKVINKRMKKTKYIKQPVNT